jgi:hypothetical protein
MARMGCLNEISEPTQRRGKGLTLDEDCNVDRPHASCYRYDDLLPIPNGDADGDPEYLIRSDRKIGELDLHAEHNQERSSSNGQICKDLETKKGFQKVVLQRSGELWELLTSWKTVSTFGS